jgi:hypothetical protein
MQLDSSFLIQLPVYSNSVKRDGLVAIHVKYEIPDDRRSGVPGRFIPDTFVCRVVTAFRAPAFYVPHLAGRLPC